MVFGATHLTLLLRRHSLWTAPKYVWLNGSWPFKLETRLFYCLLSLEGIVDLKAKQPLLSLPRRLECWLGNDIGTQNIN